MTKRARSTDGARETDAFVPETDAPAQQGRAEGNLERKVGTRDELRQVKEGDVTTRVTKKDEAGQGGLGGHHGTGEDDEHS